MLFKKPLSEVEFPDIQKLRDAKIEESAILDYKEKMISDDKLVKHVTAFSNTSGGDLIFGITESGSGGYPVDILGIEGNVNKERLEQIIISNIRPRIGVQFRKIEVPDSGRIIFIIRIPEGQSRPYYDMRSHKYYKRYNYEAIHIDEFEIESLYQKRFFGASKLAKYVEETILFHRYRQSNGLPEKIDGHIIVTPLRIDDRIIDTSKGEEIRSNFDQNKIRFEPDPKQYLQGIAQPSRYGIKWNAGNKNIEAHRNGLVHFVKEYGKFVESANTKLIDAEKLYVDLLHTIQFAEMIYSLYDFMGKVRILVRVMNTLNSKISISLLGLDVGDSKCDAEEIYIEREWDSWKGRLFRNWKKYNG
jgi:hypothetical protein